jgi:alpha-L-arabinofuranosidase
MKTTKTSKIAILCACTCIWACGKSAPPDAVITIDASKIENSITPWLYGACIEDVNHEIYGGLYDQKIFGESFEEPVPGFTFDHFTAYEGRWQPTGETIAAGRYSGAKLVYDPLEVDNGLVEVELRFAGRNGDNAGLLVRVGDPGNGADNFDGYEISLAADGKRVILGKHRHNWQALRQTSVDCRPHDWNKLGVRMERGRIEVLLNGTSVLNYEDLHDPLSNGRVALRTWNSDVEFRNLTIVRNGRKEPIMYNGTTAPAISMQWDAIGTADAGAEFSHNDRGARNGRFSQTVRMTGTGIAGVANRSLNRWGIAVTEGDPMEGWLYIKGGDGFTGPVKVALQSADGAKEYATQTIENVSPRWEKYSFALTPGTSDPNSRFAIFIDRPGAIDLDQVVLMNTGERRFHGLPLRADIGKAMQREGLTFLRYGGTMVNAPEYRFKKMIGPRDTRPPYRGHWNPYSTNGFGIEEFVAFCEAAGFECAFAVNIEETPGDMADMVEYLNGPATSEWGKKRADNGHPEPYKVKYIEIGNEEVIHGDDEAAYRHYIERYNLLYDAIKSKDASVEVVCAAWWRPDSPNMEMVFRAINGKATLWDYHPWADDPLTTGRDVARDLARMQELFLQWDPDTRMKCAIFEENGNLHNMQRALGHVVLQNAVRRHGDFVFTSCAANALQPYLQNDNGWDQGQVFFTPTQVWGMPPYYAQQMASANHMPLLVAATVEGDLDVTATSNEEGTSIVVHVANTSDREIRTRITGLAGFRKLEATTLAGELTDNNTPDEPEKIVPVRQTLKISGTVSFPAHSYTILRYDR